MNIRKKVSLLLTVVIFLYAAFLIIFNSKLWNQELEKMDIESVSQNNKVILKRLEREFSALALLTKDYAFWNDSYDFVNKVNKDYIENNYSGVDLNNFSYVAIYNNAGEKLSSFEILKNGDIIPWNFLSEKINTDSIFYTSTPEKIKSGFLKMNNEIIMLAYSPIFSNNAYDNSNGILIFGKKFDKNLEDILKNEVQIPHNFIYIYENSKDDSLFIYNYLIKENNVFIDKSPKEKLIAYSIVNDIFGNAIFILQSETSKKFQIAGKKIHRYTFLFTIFLTLILLAIFYCSIKHMIISPLRLLQRIFKNISPKNPIPQAYYDKLLKKNDEISELTQEFKEMNEKIFDLNYNLESKIKERTKELRSANENLKLVEKIIENTAEGIIVTDLEGKIIKVNKGFLNMSEFTEAEVLGENPRILKSGRHDNDFYKNLWEELLINGCWSGEIWNRRKDGAIYPKWLTINTIKDNKDKSLYYIGLLIDITKLKDVENQLNHLSYYDHLTGLPNRTLFYENLNQSIKFNKRYKTNLAVFFLDLDRFKNINDTLGHTFGDEFLIKIAKKLKDRIRESDTVCRVGGDEFLIVLDKFKNIDDVILVAKDILKLIEEPIFLREKEIVSSASLGISIFPDDDDSADGLIRKADSAMYLAKDSGKGNYKFFSQDIEDTNSIRLDLEIKLRKALEENKFELFYQPQINIEKHIKGEFAIIGCEALIRWRKEDGNLIYPDVFIPLAEETKMIIPIGKWVLEEACRTAAKWFNEGLAIRVSVNVSSIQFEDPNFLDYLNNALELSGLPPQLLHLELTESMLLGNIEKTVSLLNSIKDRGILFSIDDFGTGYSSLSYIKELPASNLKIDKAFVFKMENSYQDSALVQVIISIAKTFGMNSLAEGVETKSHMEKLYEMGCEEIQGYFISKPLPQVDFENFVENSSKSDKT